MAKHWKPGKETVALPSTAPRPSRIRRDPAKLDRKGLEDKVKPKSREQEIWNAVIGVALIATGCAALIVGVSAVTSTDGSAAAAAAVSASRFTHCSSRFAPNCVLDGDTFYLAGEKVEIPTIDAPEIRTARCTAEKDRGIRAAVELHDLLNSGTVTVTTDAKQQDPDGQPLRRIEVDGRDVGVALVNAGVARDYRGGERRGWCTTS